MMKRVLLPVALSAMLIPGVASATKMSMSNALERLQSDGYKVEEIKHRDTYFHAEVYDRNCQKRHVRVEDNGKILTHDGKPAKNDRYMSAAEIARMYEGKADVKYVKEIDLHGDHYQVKVKKKDGNTHSMKLNAVTGKEMK